MYILFINYFTKFNYFTFSCKKATESYICECQPGYEADDCSVNIDECLTNQCKNAAKCIDEIANYTCQCQTGWTGTL